MKTASVISDPINLTSNPKAIPGAVVRYTVTVTNSSTTTAAESVILDDAIPTNTVYLPGSLTLDSATLTDDGTDSDQGEFEPSPPRIIVDTGTVATNGGTKTVTFEVTIQ